MTASPSNHSRHLSWAPTSNLKHENSFDSLRNGESAGSSSSHRPLSPSTYPPRHDLPQPPPPLDRPNQAYFRRTRPETAPGGVGRAGSRERLNRSMTSITPNSNIKRAGIVEQHQRRTVHNIATLSPSSRPTSASNTRSFFSGSFSAHSPPPSRFVSPQTSHSNLSRAHEKSPMLTGAGDGEEQPLGWAPPASWGTNVVGPNDGAFGSGVQASVFEYDGAKLKKKNFGKQRVLAPLQLMSGGLKSREDGINRTSMDGSGSMHSSLQYDDINLNLSDHGLTSSLENDGGSLEASSPVDYKQGNHDNGIPWEDKDSDWDRWSYNGVGSEEYLFGRFDIAATSKMSMDAPSAPPSRKGSGAGLEGANAKHANPRGRSPVSVSSVTSSSAPLLEQRRKSSLPGSFHHDVTELPPLPPLPTSHPVQGHTYPPPYSNQSEEHINRRKSLASKLVPISAKRRGSLPALLPSVPSSSPSLTPALSSPTNPSTSSPRSRYRSGGGVLGRSPPPASGSDHSLPENFAWNGIIRPPSPLKGSRGSGRRKR